MWGDEAPAAIKLTCRHGFRCCMRKVKKEGVNQGHMFFCCPNKKEDPCGYFECAPIEDEDVFESFCTINFSMPPSYNYYLKNTAEEFRSYQAGGRKASKEYLMSKTVNELANGFWEHEH